MARRTGRPARRAAAAAAAVVLSAGLVACGEGDIESADTPEGAGECEPFDMAVNPWVGYEASAYVVGHVAESRLGCDVEYQDVKEGVAWQGMSTGETDVIIENWGHEKEKAKYIDGEGTAQEAGPNGNIGIIGWYVPPWMVEEYPDILDWENLNDYADLFETSESGGKGQLLDGDPSFVTNDEALVANLDLDYQVVYAGSEAALITEFRKAEENRTPLLGYFYDPQWFLSEVPLEKVSLPEWTEGCDAVPEEVACDYPEYELDKIVSTEFAESGSPAYDLVKAFEWTNDDQNLVAKYISQDKMSPEDAAAKWVEDNPDKVDAWLE